MENYGVADRVQFGMRILDEYMPGWKKDINLDLLDLSRGGACIGGQLVGSFSQFFITMKRTLTMEEWCDADFELFLDACAVVVFDISFHDIVAEPRDIFDIRDEYVALTAEWKRILSEELVLA